MVYGVIQLCLSILILFNKSKKVFSITETKAILYLTLSNNMFGMFTCHSDIHERVGLKITSICRFICKERVPICWICRVYGKHHSWWQCVFVCVCSWKAHRYRLAWHGSLISCPKRQCFSFHLPQEERQVLTENWACEHLPAQELCISLMLRFKEWDDDLTEQLQSRVEMTGEILKRENRRGHVDRSPGWTGPHVRTLAAGQMYHVIMGCGSLLRFSQ